MVETYDQKSMAICGSGHTTLRFMSCMIRVYFNQNIFLIDELFYLYLYKLQLWPFHGSLIVF